MKSAALRRQVQLRFVVLQREEKEVGTSRIETGSRRHQGEAGRFAPDRKIPVSCASASRESQAVAKSADGLLRARQLPRPGEFRQGDPARFPAKADGFLRD